MDFTVDRTALADLIKSVIGACNPHPHFGSPVLGNVLVEVKGDTLRMACTDLEVDLRALGAVKEARGEGSVTIPMKKLSAIVQLLPGDIHEVTFTERQNTVTVKAGKGRYTLRTLPADEFPTPKEIENTITLTVRVGELLRLVTEVRASMANGDVRPALNGLLVEAEADTLTCVASDGHRMSITRGALAAPVTGKVSVIISGKGVGAIVGVLGGADKDASIDLELEAQEVQDTDGFRQAPSRSLRIGIGSQTMTVSLIDAKFPDYQAVVPRGLEHTVKVRRTSLLDAVRRTTIVATEATRPIVLSSGSGGFSVSASGSESAGMKNEALEEIEAECEPWESRIGVNGTYLADALQSLGSDDVIIKSRDAATAIRVEPANGDTTTHVIMPLRL